MTERNGDAVLQFIRAADGKLTYDGCWTDLPSAGCLDPPGTPLDSVTAIAVSPDGKSVYVVSLIRDLIAQFVRAADGKLTYDGCLASEPTAGCTDLPNAPMNTATDVKVSPDGRSVYVSALTNSAVVQFDRGLDGRLAYVGCLANGPANGCVDLPQEPISQATAVTVSADGTSVYVASDSSVSQFARFPEGQLAYVGCLGNDGSNGCADVPGEPFTGINSITVSPDDTALYATASGSDALVRLTRFPDGHIAYGECFADLASNECVDLPGFENPRSAALSPDGRSLYAVAGQGTVNYLLSGTAGPLSWSGCWSSTAIAGCFDLAHDLIGNASDLAVSPDGDSVYVVSPRSGSISHFSRGPAPPPPGRQPTPTPTPPDTTPPQTLIRKGPAKTTTMRIATFRFSSSEKGSSFQCKVDRRKKWVACRSPKRLNRLAAGKHRFMVRAIDRGGNVDPTPAQRRWKVGAGTTSR